MYDFEKKMLPIGIESFTEICTDDFYYVDKTALIRDLLRRRGKVNLFTRPRRFGKTLNMSMLRYFFEMGGDKTIFDGLDILKETSLCEKYMGKFPVVSISLKSANGSDYTMARSLMCSIIGNEAIRFYELATSDRLTDVEKMIYKQLTAVDTTGKSMYAMSDAVLMGSLKTLSGLLEKHYGKKVVLLIDEYDVPLAKANEQGYYSQMITLIRNMFEQGLKTNESVQLAVLTGCLRVSKESIFTGLNNLKVFSITDPECDVYFGFTDKEVREMLEYYGLEDKYDLIREWYDGYRFGSSDVYCPWDVISYVDKLLVKRDLPPQDYWINTSSNDVIRRLLEGASTETRDEIERLIAGESIQKRIHEELTYKEIYENAENVWSLLFVTGYLTQRGEAEEKMRNLVIPNREIHNIFMTQIRSWMQSKVREDRERLNAFCEAFRNADGETVQTIFTEYLDETVSIRDTAVRTGLKENFYHGFLLGLLRFREDWKVASNRESGTGYADIVIEIFREKTAIVIEMKYVENGDLEAGCRVAMEQIRREGYDRQPSLNGMNRIIKCGMACHVKDCKAVFEE
ncbi:AAA family ATPase [Acetatifactor muris]|uniref:AAA family ATPase n=1 Tax=Acetatifactor muris TaxID=879566 RepID=UPI0023F06E48|nr:AAA family ATPase [Acetatifactor muris]